MPLKSLENFDPNGVANINNTAYGLPFTEDEAQLIILPIPWDATVSYRSGTAHGPAQVIESSYQVDLYDEFAPGEWKKGIFTCDIPEFLHERSRQARKHVEEILEKMEQGFSEEDEVLLPLIKKVNEHCEEMNIWVQKETEKYLAQGKMVGILGGDHSTPLGYIQNLHQKYPNMSILQIDAHMDLRNAYEGFLYSHASIMYNVLQNCDIHALVQVGVRDFCDEEIELGQSRTNVYSFTHREIKNALYQGVNLDRMWDQVIEKLSSEVYISYDIDGLHPSLCPHTGTPVLGGFQTEEIDYLLEKLLAAGKRIVGFDLSEVCGDEDNHSIDSIVGARVLYKLANFSLKSNG